jgi:nucleoside-diphosphate-sugar epimerase
VADTKVLVTGVTGFIAGHCVEELLTHGYAVRALVSADKAKRELGWVPRPAKESIMDTAESLIRYGVVPRRGADKHTPTHQTA